MSCVTLNVGICWVGWGLMHLGVWAFEKGSLSLTWHHVACECNVSGIMPGIMPNLRVAEGFGVSEIIWPELKLQHSSVSRRQDLNSS